MKRVLLLAEARQDVLDIFHWYEGERKGLGGVFRVALKQSIQHIRQAPLASRWFTKVCDAHSSIASHTRFSIELNPV